MGFADQSDLEPGFASRRGKIGVCVLWTWFWAAVPRL